MLQKQVVGISSRIEYLTVGFLSGRDLKLLQRHLMFIKNAEQV